MRTLKAMISTIGAVVFAITLAGPEASADCGSLYREALEVRQKELNQRFNAGKIAGGIIAAGSVTGFAGMAMYSATNNILWAPGGFAAGAGAMAAYVAFHYLPVKAEADEIQRLTELLDQAHVGAGDRLEAFIASNRKFIPLRRDIIELIIRADVENMLCPNGRLVSEKALRTWLDREIENFI